MTAAALFRLLGDDARLRLLRLLDGERLNVGELTSILGIAQSGVSRHLGLLKDAGLVEEKRENGYTYFRTAPAAAREDRREPRREVTNVWPLLRAQFAAAAGTLEGRADDARLEEVRRVRQENFDEDRTQHGVAAERRQIVPGRSWAAWARALGHLLPPLEVADLGCGEGYLTFEAARFARHVIGVDRSAAVLARAKARTEHLRARRGAAGGNIEWKRGALEKLPLADASVDVALLSQALHHAAQPTRALAEAVRIVRPGGRVLVLDLRRHEEQWVRERLGDKWLGFDDAELRRLLDGAGLSDIKVTVGTRRQRDPFTVLIASGAKPAAAGSRKDSRHAR